MTIRDLLTLNRRARERERRRYLALPVGAPLGWRVALWRFIREGGEPPPPLPMVRAHDGTWDRAR